MFPHFAPLLLLSSYLPDGFRPTTMSRVVKLIPGRTAFMVCDIQVSSVPFLPALAGGGMGHPSWLADKPGLGQH